MTKYIYLKTVYLSFFSQDLYRDVLRNWKGLGLKYLMMLSFFAAVITSVNLVRMLHSFDTAEVADNITNRLFEDPDLSFEQNLNRVLDIVSQIPSVMVKDSELSISEKEPYFIKDPISGKDWLIFDSTGEYKTLEGTDAIFLITKSSVILKNENGVEEVNYLDRTLQQKDEKNVNKFLYVLSQIPKISINNGIASMMEPSPYFIKDKDDFVYLAVDTTEAADLQELEKAFIAVTKDRIIYQDFFSKEKDAKINEILISDINADVIYSSIESLVNKIRSFLNWSIPLVALPMITLLGFVSLLMIVLIYAIITIILAKIKKLEDFNFEHAVRLSAIAITPVFVAKHLLPVFLPSQSLVYFIVSLFYLHFAVNANTHNKKNNAV